MDSQNKPQTEQLRGDFKTLDAEGKGYIVKDQFFAYMQHKPRQLPLYITNELFKEDGKLTQKDFITFMLAYAMNLEKMALTKLKITRQLEKYADASPSGGALEMKESYVKFRVAAKDQPQGEVKSKEKKKFMFQIGTEKQAQQKKIQQINEVFGMNVHELFLLLKFKVSGKGEEIAEALKNSLEMAKGMASEMAPELAELLECVNVNVKYHEDYVYLVIEVNNQFFDDVIGYLNEFIALLNPEAHILFSFVIESSYLNKILVAGSEKKVQDAETTFSLDIDSQSMLKLKEIFLSEVKAHSEEDKIGQILFCLFNEVKFEANFQNSQKLLNESGVSSSITEAKGQLDFIKQMGIKDTLAGFLPGSGDLIELLRENGRIRELSLNLKNCFVGMELDLMVEGLFDLL